MTSRRQQARAIREAAAQHAHDRGHVLQTANGDERSSWNYAFNFTKGLRHCFETGLVAKPDDFQKLIKGIDSGDPRDFQDTPTGHDQGEPWVSGLGDDIEWRAWESEAAGNTFDLQGPDAQATTMPPAPAADSAELVGEMGEVYAQALLRDCPLSELRHGARGAGVDAILRELNAIEWFDSTKDHADPNGSRRTELTRQTAFRGIAPGDTVGPYLSQFLLIGTEGLGSARSPRDGIVQYGGQSIDQRVHKVEEVDFMTKWDEWFDVQNGADVRGTEKYEATSRFITTGRDIATYVHYDALYQAYLTACLVMLGQGVPFDTGIPFQDSDYIDRQQGFAHFGGPHILTLVTEVATRALKNVRFQKFNVHRRARPEVVAARYEKALLPELAHLPGLLEGRAELVATGIGQRILDANKAKAGCESMLLPMAFPEGSPMHPSYGAGHATVAGACVTILKAFFDHSHVLDTTGAGPGLAYIPNKHGKGLTKTDVYDADGNPAKLTVEGELNKLASNISIGRNWGGVHYFSDYWESLKMGEEIAIGILEEHKFCFQENFSMTIPLFEGGTVRI